MDLQALKEYALSFQGVPYQWGGKGYPNDFGLDCSGFVSIVLRKAGIVLPQKEMNAHMLYWWAESVGNPSGGELGALAFFGRMNYATHVGLMIDDKNMISAAGGSPKCTSVEVAKQTGACVKVQPVSFYRKPALLACVRISYPA